ncbi:MAG TPA: hypothetical protein VN736_15750 [Candidatus Limnocylindrales bacterium]|nr:hypothetical protein [Candidatus Limnocylindrales bacterium]
MLTQKAPRRQWPYARIVISAFIAFNLFAITCWCVPLDTPLVVACRNMVRPYMLYFGLFQKWDMFAPDPTKLNSYIDAVVTYRDGQTSKWGFPRMEELGIVDKYFEERYRKYMNDNLRLDTNSGLWPDAARYIARANNRAGDPPVLVTLVRHWSIVPPPGPDGEPGYVPWSQFEFFHYTVAPGDLP